MKRIFAMLLALLRVFSLAACSKDDDDTDDPVNLTVTSDGEYYNAGGEYNDRFAYEIFDGNKVMITGFVSDYTPHAITVPAVIENCPVEKIASAAFYQCSQITAVSVPASVKIIEDMAFAGCVQLTTVTFAEGANTLTDIGGYAFAQCVKLGTISLPDSLLTLGEGAFFRCAVLTAIQIPAGITAIGDMTFMDCTALATVTGGNAVKSIGEYAFCGCAALASYTVGAEVTAIGANAFALCDTLASVTFANTTGWGYRAEADDEELEAVDVADAAVIAKLLKTDYATVALVRQ